MSARIVCCANQKGGAGKTTVTMALAATMATRGYSVVVVDADLQGSASIWAESARGDPFPARVVHHDRPSFEGESLLRILETLSTEADVLIIDCPPSVESPVARAALLVSDWAIVPVMPSPPDLASARVFMQLVETAMTQAPTLKGARVVPSMVERTQVSSAFLGQILNIFPVTEAKLRRRTAYQQAAALGGSIQSTRDAKAIAEVEALTDEVLTLLDLPTHPAPKEAST